MNEFYCLRSDLKHNKTAFNLQFNEQMKSLHEEGKKIFHLGFGQSPFPIPVCAQESLKEHAHIGQYLPVKGLIELRKSICQFHHNEDKLNHFDPMNVVVGPGSKELIYLLLAVTNGDVLLLAPTWTTYMPQAVLSKHTVKKLFTNFDHGWKLTPKLLDQAFSTPPKDWSILILCNPDNPTGTAYTLTELEELSAKFRKYKILVLSDEIYSRLSFSNNHVSLAKVYPEGTILSCGISKWASCGGWRLGYHLYPPQLQALGQAVSDAASHTYTTVSAPIQYAAIKLFEYGQECKDYVAHCKRILHAVASYCCRRLRDVGVKVMMPSSGFYILPDFEVIRPGLAARDITTGTEMCSTLLQETGVAFIAAGPAFLHKEEDLTVRLCYVNFDGNLALKASDKVGLENDLPNNFLPQFCAPTVEAIDLLVQWVNKQKLYSNK